MKFKVHKHILREMIRVGDQEKAKFPAGVELTYDTMVFRDSCIETLPVEIVESLSPTVPMQHLLSLSNAQSSLYLEKGHIKL